MLKTIPFVLSERLLFKKKIKKSSRCHVEADLSSGVNDYEGFIRFLVIQADIPFFFLHLIYSLIRLPDQDESENVVKTNRRHFKPTENMRH